MTTDRDQNLLALANPRVQRVRRLVRRAADRREEGVVVAEGAKVIHAAFDGGAEIRELYLAPHADPELEVRALDAGVMIHRLAEGAMAKVASTVTPQAEVALVARPTASLESLSAAALVLVAIGVQDPGNAGTMVRTALAAGASGILFSEGSVDVFSPKTVRSSAGAVFALPVISGISPQDALRGVAELGLARLGTDSEHGEDLYQADLPERIAVVAGNEANGLPASLAPYLDLTVRIPMQGPAESLNVGVASAIVCFEVVRRQRTRAGGAGA